MTDCGGEHIKCCGRTFCVWGYPQGVRYHLGSVMEVGSDGTHWDLIPESMSGSDFNELFKQTQAHKERKERDLGELKEGSIA